MTLTDIIAKITLFAKRAIVNDNSSNTAVSINQTGSGTGLSVKSVAGTSVLVENTNPVAGKGGKLEIFSSGGDFVFDGGTDGIFSFVNTTVTGTTAFSAAKTYFTGGNVGIGIANPTFKLEVEGNIKAGRTDTVNEGGQIQLSRAIDNLSAWAIDVFGNTVTPSFRIINITTNTEHLRIEQNGNVGIGVVPVRKLHVNGLVRLQGLSTYANNAAAITGGLAADDVYKTVTGELRIVV